MSRGKGRWSVTTTAFRDGFTAIVAQIYRCPRQIYRCPPVARRWSPSLAGNCYRFR